MGKAALEAYMLAAWAFAAASSCVSAQKEKLASVMLCKAESGSDVFGFVPQ